jgi:phospholipid transport system substrate-binding protein
MPHVARITSNSTRAARRIGLALSLGLAIVIWVGAAQNSCAAAQPTSPKEASKFIETLGERTMALFAQTSLPMPERETRIRALMREVFAFKTIGRFVLASSWRTAKPDQRDEYLSLFSEFLVRTYSRRLGGYGGYGFAIAQAKPLGRRDALVTTVIKQSSGPSLKAGWRVRASGDGYKIVDVMVEGVSMAVTQRSEFDTIVRRDGLDKLIEILRAKVNTFSAKSS